MQHKYSDGGRRAAGYKGKVGDCSTRAIAIATGTGYKEVLELQVSAILETGDPNASATANCSRVLEDLGWEHIKVKRVGGRWPLPVDALPYRGTFIANMHGHLAAVVNSVLYDEWDSRWKPVYGYWKQT